MRLRPCTVDDLPDVVDLTIEVFGPFYEQGFRSMVPQKVFEHQHGRWEQDYREQVPTLLDPEHHKYLTVAEAGSGEIAGYIAWNVDPDRLHGEIDVVAVRDQARGGGVGRALCEHALASMRAAGMQVVELGTGGDDFHTPARRLYESLGFSLVPVAVYLRALD